MLAKALRSLQGVLIAVLTIALIATGFGHRTPAPEDQALMAVALANGASPADFCGDQPGGGGHLGSDCLACQIAGAADLPPAKAMLIDIEFAYAANLVAAGESRLVERVRDLGHPSQGPPVA
jgi:hypothetical protein